MCRACWRCLICNLPILRVRYPVLHTEQRGYTVYQNTRRMLLSESNPFFFKGKAGEGIGGPHVRRRDGLAVEYHHSRADQP